MTAVSGPTTVAGAQRVPRGQVLVTDHVVNGPHGELRIRVYEPAPAAARVAGLVWCHGGAFMHGDLEMAESDWVARELAARGVVVASVGYRLAPAFDYRDGTPPADPQPGRVRFPVPHDEVTFAFGWAAGRFGVEAGRWSLGGTSAGGNLAGGAALRLRDVALGRAAAADGTASGPGAQPRSVVLVYPVAHYELPAPSRELAEKAGLLEAEANFRDAQMLAINDNYLGHPGPSSSPYAFPGGQDLRGLPPHLVLNSDSDALRSSGQAYAAELAAAGVDVYLVREDGTRHGHLNQPGTPGAARSIARIATWLTADALIGTAHEPSPAPDDVVLASPPAAGPPPETTPDDSPQHTRKQS
ncbi:alpha/beta hydrolase [Myceligenerans crystallogenes]|uniref:Alpha/beta hydrolase fold domain-containing protein n=1 Tax=Myceligenerans crystallogenes TaxID=316335 RepID=A0ABN2N295_9MICO